MPKTAVKQPAALYPAPQSKAAVNDAIAAIGVAQRERARIQATMGDEMAAIKARYEQQAAPWNEQIERLSIGVHTWCAAHRDDLTGRGKTKSAALSAGEVKWRMRPPSCTVRGAESVIEALKRLGLGRFVRTKEEINKEAILNDPEAVTGVAGIKIGQREDFVIVPFETALEEVA